MEAREKNMDNLECTDYNVNEINNYDFRFEASRKDAVFIHALGIICTGLATVWMFVFGMGNPEDMTYFLGMPVWITGAIAIYLVMLVIGLVYVCKWKEFTFEKREDRNGGNV